MSAVFIFRSRDGSDFTQRKLRFFEPGDGGGDENGMYPDPNVGPPLKKSLFLVGIFMGCNPQESLENTTKSINTHNYTLRGYNSIACIPPGLSQ